MNRYFLLLFQCLALPMLAQKWDNNWPGGLTEYPGSPGSGSYLIHFESGFPKLDTVDLKMNFESTVASLSDSTGKLMAYTNGCRIADANGLSLIDGDGLNPGEVRDSVCPQNGYISPRGAMFIPMPGSETTKAVLLHMGVHYDADNRVLYGPFYYSVVDFASNSVIDKNHQLLDILPGTAPNGQSFEPFSVVRHGNGRDWWVVVPELGTNHYHLFLLGKAGISEILPIQQIGPTLGGHRPGSTIFSPDGRKYARSHNHTIVVMDFDRCTGSFQNPVSFDRPVLQFGGGGLAFSPDGQQLLASTQRAILSADLSLAQPVLDTLLGSAVIAPFSLGYCQLGPDSSLYFASMQRLKKMPFVKNAFNLPQAADYSALALPVWSVRSVPYFPNFRLYNFVKSPCDTVDLTMSIADESIDKPFNQLTIQPNPARTTTEIHIPELWRNSNLRIIDLLGRTLFLEKIESRSSVQLDVSGWSGGAVFVQVLREGAVIGSGKILVVH